MTKMKYLNKEQSEKIFKNGFVKYDYFEMCAFARWAKNCEKWSNNKIEKHLRSEFFKNGLNIVLLQESIHTAVLSSRFDFLEQDSVDITKKEIEKISKIKTRRWQKAMFGILVFAKKFGVYSKENLYFWRDIKEILGKSGIYMKEEEYQKFISYVGKELGYLNAVIRKVNLSWRVGIYTDGELFCTVRDFSDFQKLLPYFCSVCGKETKNKKGYCEEHAKEIKKERDRLWISRKRNPVGV